MGCVHIVNEVGNAHFVFLCFLLLALMNMTLRPLYKRTQCPLTDASQLPLLAFTPSREISAESERESQLLQNHWSEVRYLVRCIYRQTGTPLADDHDHPLDRDKEGMKELVDR